MMAQSVLTVEDETPCEEEAAAWWTLAGPPPEAAAKIPTPRLTATAVVTGTAIRTARLFLPRRRRTDRWPVTSIDSTSIGGAPLTLPRVTVDQRQSPGQGLDRIRILSGFKRGTRPNPRQFLAKFLRRRLRGIYRAGISS